MPAWRIVRQLGVARAGDAAKKMSAEMDWKSRCRTPDLTACYFGTTGCSGTNVIIQTALGAMRVCQAHRKHADEYQDE